MAYEVRIPSLGESVTEAVIGTWMKKDGEPVAVDDPILELESDKANMEIAAEKAGVLRVLKKEGDTVTVGEVVATIDEAAPGASAPSAASAASPAPAAKSAPAAPSPAPASAPTPAAAAPQAEPAPARAAAPAPPAEAPPVDESRPLSPSVRRIAAEENLDLRNVQGTGPGGRITKADALSLAASRTAESVPASPATSAAATAAAATASAPRATPSVVPVRRPEARASEGDEERVPMSRLRQVIARRLVEAQQTAAILTTFNEVDLTAVQELRARYKKDFEARHGVGLGYMSFFVKACCAAAPVVPELNAEIQGTDIVYRRYVHMGVAVGTDRGLVVPVVRNADKLSFAEIESEIVRLSGLARDNKLSIDDLSGATFTISNGGVYGSLLSTPILNPPQSGILGMHKIEKRPIVVNDEIVIRPMMYLALSYDHRIVDGKGAVTFLVRVKEALEDPARLLVGL